MTASTNVCPLVVTEHGTGFLDPRTRALRMAFGVHVSPEPADIRPATPDEARTFFSMRAATRASLTDYYNRADARGVNTGD